MTSVESPKQFILNMDFAEVDIGCKKMISSTTLIINNTVYSRYDEYDDDEYDDGSDNVKQIEKKLAEKEKV
uniref:Uncharacterized protein n=1 Tax=Arion vulgaris TaxID=1028688 RepID=A0A0B6Y2J1_9EUPU